MKRSARIVIFGYALLSFIGFAAYAHASATLGSASGYAWGEDLGWINFGCSQCTVQISDTAITGYVWSSTAGWINLSPTTAGVVNDDNGTLSGYAWSSSLGWINFSGVSITDTGSFSGIAGTASSSAGRITFNCSSCDVTTDWRPAAAQNPISVSSGGGGGGTSGAISSSTEESSTMPGSTILPTSLPLSSNSAATPKPGTIIPSGAPTTVPIEAQSFSSSSSSSHAHSVTPSSSLLVKLVFYLLIVIGIIFFIVFAMG